MDGARERLATLLERRREGEADGYYLSPYSHPHQEGQPELHADVAAVLAMFGALMGVLDATIRELEADGQHIAAAFVTEARDAALTTQGRD